MTDSRIFKVEKRTGRERTIKSYVLRNNVLDEKGEKTIEESKEYIEYYDGEKKLSSVTLFNNSRPLIVEIGFGMGDATVEIAENRKDFNYLGLEVYLDGVVKILKKIREKDLKNLKIMRFNAVDVITDMIEDGSIDGFHIFFPDPWMKKKHHKRRLMNEDFIRLLLSKLKEGGYIYFVTDWVEYADQVLELTGKIDGVINPYGGFAEHVSWRPGTKFERKGLEKEHEVREIWIEKGRA